MDNDSKLRLLYIGKMLQNTDEEHPLTNADAYDMTSFKLEVNVAVNHVFFGWVFGFGGKVRIKAPEDVKKQYKTMIEQVMAEEV